MKEMDSSKMKPEKAFFSTKTPFSFYSGMTIYIEPEWNERINCFICSNLGLIENSCHFYKSFVYLPRIVKEMDNIIHYNRPNLAMDFVEKKSDFRMDIQEMYRELFACRLDAKNWIPETPMLMSYEYSEDDYEAVLLWPLCYESDQQLYNCFKKVLSINPFEGIRCSSIEEHNPPEDPKDYADSESVYTIAQEIKTRIEKLKLMGVSEYVIKHLVLLPEAKLSRLRITNDYRIVLIDYNDMEIMMPTLSKVVFFFFLRHPEGMRFKDMHDYKEELLQIYCHLSNRENIDKMEQSIEELVDTTRNSINEKCSRIRTAFVSRFSEELANNYCITGYLGREKRITLDRGLVIDETGITY